MSVTRTWPESASKASLRSICPSIKTSRKTPSPRAYPKELLVFL
jgi:hypothetical protein